MNSQIIQGDCLSVLATLPEKSIQTCVTSPPYYGLRDYGVSGQIGLEETPEQYVQKLVEVFRQVWRVLRDDGTVWLNLGDSYAGANYRGGGIETASEKQRSNAGTAAFMGQSGAGISSNFLDCFQRIIKGYPLIFGNATTIRITSKSRNVALNDNGFPYGEFLSLFGIKRVTIKQRDNNFCQVFNILNNESYCWIGVPIYSFNVVDASNVEIVLDAIDCVSIVISNHNTDASSIFRVSPVSGARSGVEGDSTLTVKEATKPITKRIKDIEPIGDTVMFDTPLKRFPNIYLVDDTVTFGDRLSPPASYSGYFRIAHASVEKVSFSLDNCGIDISTTMVTQLFTPNHFGSLVCYAELYDKAKRMSNTLRPKQELGIPFLVRQALIEDGWICRSTICWHKTNCMPESVQDRPTKAHEYVFLLSKQERYFYDAEAIAEPAIHIGDTRHLRTDSRRALAYSTTASRETTGNPQASTRNKRSVWSIPTTPYAGSHFAVMSPELARLCILAGSATGDIVLDPFSGAGTTSYVANKAGRGYIGIELNPAYVKLAEDRIHPSLWDEIA